MRAGFLARLGVVIEALGGILEQRLAAFDIFRRIDGQPLDLGFPFGIVGGRLEFLCGQRGRGERRLGLFAGRRLGGILCKRRLVLLFAGGRGALDDGFAAPIPILAEKRRHDHRGQRRLQRKLRLQNSADTEQQQTGNGKHHGRANGRRRFFGEYGLQTDRRSRLAGLLVLDAGKETGCSGGSKMVGGSEPIFKPPAAVHQLRDRIGVGLELAPPVPGQIEAEGSDQQHQQKGKEIGAEKQQSADAAQQERKRQEPLAPGDLGGDSSVAAVDNRLDRA